MKQYADAQQHRTYLEKLYMVKGNSFKVVRQPKRKTMMAESVASMARAKEGEEQANSEIAWNLYRDDLRQIGLKSRKYLASGLRLSASHGDSGLNQSTEESIE